MTRHDLFIDAPFADLWAGQDPFVAVDALPGQVFRELEGRRTLRTEVQGRGYFVKIHRGIGWGEIVKNLFSLRLPVLGARNEWQAIQRLKTLGVDTMHAVAYGRRGWNPAAEHSFIVTEELAPTISLEDYCRDWPSQPPAFAMKQALIRRVAEMAGRMHRGGVNHRDFYICHFLLHLDPAPQPSALKLSVIDLHRAQCRAATPRRWRDKDLASLYFSALEIGLTQRDFLRFLRLYFQRSLRDIFQAERPLLDHLAAESRRLQARYVRKFADTEGA
ncbi:lipopolysaccharide core heptose(I) kinase RfaP [Azonexus sp.]|uniref:lipopolysaccharide core heptose(I) kinase RfaP n=1 Tax=Azonexus sp. TaxID=1872668 RepID=UPI0027B96D6F|nr:lipopolysaccharide core heptose(I) kinase RfaP [Azonexus sp.]